MTMNITIPEPRLRLFSSARQLATHQYHSGYPDEILVMI